ncbi:flagellar hook-length control protein FliK [Neobacillus niacini]|uniref:flagellar hook-length control protein FliK n=1 Tax=Neobacillus niacini TaxID=86668 RepID=UPI00285EAB01|nr:flagellar hook-length control protein FliK [Neobacillus niacini]MDR7001014.1 flagellar hook-length control protein FliK [Neobacillus niacini]
MEVNQISIKINQTTQADGGKQTSAEKAEGTANSFDQILAMFNLLGQANQEAENKSSSSMKDSSKLSSTNQEDEENISPEEWQQIEAILLAWIQSGQQVSPLPTGENPVMNNTSGSESQSPINLAQLGPLLQKVGLQKMDGLNQLSDSDKNKLVQTIQDLQSLAQQKPSEISNDIQGQKLSEILKEIENKLGIILNGEKSENLLKSEPSEIGQSRQPLFVDIKQNSNLLFKPRLSLDKNQVDFPSSINLDSSVLDGSKQIKINEQPFLVNLQPQTTTGWNGSGDSVAPSVLPVSNFVPEVSEWMGTFMRISAGQTGGTEAKFSLYPEHLGHVEIKIFSQEGQLSAQILTDTAMAKDALEGHLHDLRQALQQHGIIVQKLDISQQAVPSTEQNQASLSFSQNGSSSSYEQRSFTFNQNPLKKQNDSNQNEIETEPIPITYGRTAPRSTSSIDFTA